MSADPMSLGIRAACNTVGIGGDCQWPACPCSRATQRIGLTDRPSQPLAYPEAAARAAVQAYLVAARDRPEEFLYDVKRFGWQSAIDVLLDELEDEAQPNAH